MKTLKFVMLIFIAGCLLPQISAAQTTGELVQQGREFGMDERSLAELQERAESRGLADSEFAAILQSALTLAGQGLPSDHIIQKALEGLSKAVPGQRVIRVLQDLQRSTEQSAELVGPWVQQENVRNMIGRSGRQSPGEFRNAMIKSTSKTLSQNVPVDLVRDVLADLDNDEILGTVGPAQVTTAIGILSELPTTADEPEVSRTFLMRALRGGFSSSELQKLPSAISIAQMRSQLPASNVMRGVGSQLEGGTPASQVLQNLFNGNIGGGPGSTPPGLDRRGNGQGNL